MRTAGTIGMPLLILAGFLCSVRYAPAVTAQPGGTDNFRLNLEKAIALALDHNRGVRIAELKVEEKRKGVAEVRADALPRLSSEAYISSIQHTQALILPRGSLAVIDQDAPVPEKDMSIKQGSDGVAYGAATLSQPLTQLIRINAAVRAARADVELAGSGQRKAELDVILGVKQLYLGLLVSQKRRETARLGVEAAEQAVEDARAAVSAGLALPAVFQAASARLMQRRQELLTEENRCDDLRLDLNEVLGLPLDDVLELDNLDFEMTGEIPSPDLESTAPGRNPDLEAALAGVDKAEAGVSALKSEYIPDLGLFVQYVYQDGVPFLPRDNLLLGIKASWTLFDFFKRGNAVAARQLQLAQARENAERVREHVTVEVLKSRRRVERARHMLEVAEEAMAARTEAARLQTDRSRAGFTSGSYQAEASFEESQAATDMFTARIDYMLSLAEFEHALGMTGEIENGIR